MFTAPVVATSGSTDVDAPLVVLLHGRGSDERAMISLANHLPGSAAYAAVRAPIAEGSGYAWFANRGVGRPVASSIDSTMAWFTRWLDSVAPVGRPVIVIGFSGGAAFAGGLILSDPSRYAGAAILHGTLPFDAGIPVDVGRLAHLPVFLAQGDQDVVIPAELLARTWTYLLGESGAPVSAFRDPGGHGISIDVVHALGEWIAHRVNFLSTKTVPVAGPRREATWPTLATGRLPQRAGDRPAVSWSIPQQQLSDAAPVELQERLALYVQSLDGVSVRPSSISVPGARAFVLDDTSAGSEAFLVHEAGEFAHLHPPHDGSLHLVLPVDLAADVVTKGWGRMHPWAGGRLTAGFVMIHGPRSSAKLTTIEGIVAASHALAIGGGGRTR